MLDIIVISNNGSPETKQTYTEGNLALLFISTQFVLLSAGYTVTNSYHCAFTNAYSLTLTSPVDTVSLVLYA